MTADTTCPMGHGDASIRTLLGRQNKDWWPDALAVDVLTPNGAANPMGDQLAKWPDMQRRSRLWPPVAGLQSQNNG